MQFLWHTWYFSFNYTLLYYSSENGAHVKTRAAGRSSRTEMAHLKRKNTNDLKLILAGSEGFLKLLFRKKYIETLKKKRNYWAITENVCYTTNIHIFPKVEANRMNIAPMSANLNYLGSSKTRLKFPVILFCYIQSTIPGLHKSFSTSLKPFSWN